MGLGDLIDDAGDGLEHLVSGARHAAGAVADQGAHLLSKGLDAAGLHTAAGAVTDFGDAIANHQGDQVPEQQLGQTDDPTQLIHGDLAAITHTATRLTQFADAFGQTARSLADIDTAHWHGSAADAFRHAYQQHPRAWSDAHDAFHAAATAWQHYGHAVHQAQQQARQAIALYQQGTQATTTAQSRYRHAVTTYQQHAAAYNLVVAGGGDPGPAPQPPVPFTDPGAGDRQYAQQLLADARHQRDAAGVCAQQAIADATAHSPQTPAFTQRMLDDVSDLTTATALEGEHFAGGIAKSTGDLVKLARGLDPLDAYNATHPAQFVDGVSSTAAGVVHTALHPQQLVQGVLGSDWRADPAQALGRLVPNVIAAMGSDGATETASAAEATTEAANTAGQVATDAAENSAGDLTSDATHALDRPDSPAGAARGPSLSAAEMQRADIDLGTVASDPTKIHVHDTTAPTTPEPSGTSQLRQRLDGDDPHPAPADHTPSTSGPLAHDPQIRTDLAHTALRQPDLATMDNLDHTVVWRRDHGMLYRSGNRGPAVFTDGFPPSQVDGLNLHDHVNYNSPNTSYVSTTTNPDYWQTWGSDAHYFYEIDAPGGVDANATLGPHQNSHENEIAMPGGIRPERVKGFWPILHDPLTHDPTLGDYVPNPNYQPPRSSDP